MEGRHQITTCQMFTVNDDNDCDHNVALIIYLRFVCEP